MSNSCNASKLATLPLRSRPYPFDDMQGRCPTLSFWRHVGVHNMAPFPPSADTVTNHQHILARHKQRQVRLSWKKYATSGGASVRQASGGFQDFHPTREDSCPLGGYRFLSALMRPSRAWTLFLARLMRSSVNLSFWNCARWF